MMGYDKFKSSVQMDKELTGNSIQLKVSNFMFVYLLFTWMRQTGQERRSKYEQSSTLLRGRQIMPVLVKETLSAMV